MDWFERLTGFGEESYRDTQAKLAVEGPRLRSCVNGKDYGIGALELASLADLRRRVGEADGPQGCLSLRIVRGDVRTLHHLDSARGALFQVASQFNLLEMIGPGITPEDGVTRYAVDPTQGPACAVAAGAATIFRNYFAPVDGQIGQTKERQLDGLADLGAMLSAQWGLPVSSLWAMRNGYALCTGAGLKAIADHLDAADEAEVDALRGALRIGLHWDVEVTDAGREPRPVVSQTFCSALPVAYGEPPQDEWRASATLVLEAAYEATF